MHGRNRRRWPRAVGHPAPEKCAGMRSGRRSPRARPSLGLAAVVQLLVGRGAAVGARQLKSAAHAAVSVAPQPRDRRVLGQVHDQLAAGGFACASCRRAGVGVERAGSCRALRRAGPCARRHLKAGGATSCHAPDHPSVLPRTRYRHPHFPLHSNHPSPSAPATPSATCMSTTSASTTVVLTAPAAFFTSYVCRTLHSICTADSRTRGGLTWQGARDGDARAWTHGGAMICKPGRTWHRLAQLAQSSGGTRGPRQRAMWGWGPPGGPPHPSAPTHMQAPFHPSPTLTLGMRCRPDKSNSSSP